MKRTFTEKFELWSVYKIMALGTNLEFSFCHFIIITITTT